MKGTNAKKAVPKQQNGLTQVRFIKHAGIYNSGEVAWFSPDAAERLVTKGQAEYTDEAPPQEESGE